MNLQIFEDQEFGKIRTVVEQGGTVFFCGTDVAAALGYKNTKDALLRHCREDGVVFHDLIDSLSRVQRTKFISEGNVYRLIVHSKLPAAEKFERWVMDEILPSVRKHGAYVTKEMLDKLMTDPDFAIGLFSRLKAEQERNTALTNQLEETEPKAEYYDSLVETNLLTNIRQTAKELHLSEKAFTSLLIEFGLCYRSPRGIIMPYSGMTKKGYAQLKEYSNGTWSGIYTLFTPTGRDFIRRKFKSKGALVNIR